ncbi:unnamed protein product [Mytilus edulis]|uniref:Uncharacterized protein n=1 Tax=Mytilus edulis TaxID=6550 RepID=A0A8S3U4A6_MYTED|nr:unnamed protein product [Mytilus edulis]
MLKQKLDTDTEIKRNALALQEEELDSFQNKILTSKVFLQQSSLSKNAPAFLVSVSSIDKQLDEIKKTEFDRQPKHIANMKFIDDREQSEKIIKHLGMLLTSTAVPYKSEIKNPKTMYAKTDGIFEVRLKDSQAKCTINSPGTYQANVLLNGTTFFKLDTISCLEHELEENSSDFVSEKQVEKEISAQVRIRGCEGLQKDETDTSKDSSNVKPNNDKKKKKYSS